MSRFCIFIPLKNGLPLVTDTVRSIIWQRPKYSGSISLVVCDSESSDGTLKYFDSIQGDLEVSGIDLEIHSRKDNSMYDGLAYGMANYRQKADYYCYINGGDYFSPNAFSIVSRSLAEGENWVTGMPAIYNAEGALVSLFAPFRYPRKLIQQGYFGTIMPCIQQESTFWSRHLQDILDLDALSRYKFAGDFYMWKTFSESSELKIIRAWLAGFRIHSNQKSKVFAEEYREEFLSIVSRRNLASYVEALYIRTMLSLPFRLRDIFE